MLIEDRKTKCGRQEWRLLHRFAAIGATIASLGLAACGHDPVSPAALQAGTAVSKTTMEDSARYSVAEARSALSNKTRMILTPAHGPQIIYTTTDGQLYLWFPGSDIIVGGTWQIEEPQYRKRLTSREGVSEFEAPMPMYCYEYRASGYNPVTGMRSSKKSCEVAARTKAATVEAANGDIFGLAQQVAVPFVLPRNLDSFAQVKARLSNASAPQRAN